MNKSFFACSCAQRPASFEIHISRLPVNTRYPFVCEACLNKNIMGFFAAHKTDLPLPEWHVDDFGTYIQKVEQESVDFLLRPHGIIATEERVAELRKNVDVVVLELQIEGETITGSRMVKLEKEIVSEPV